MLTLKKKLKPVEQGFTLVEVLVAILITTLFVGVAMQTMVFAAIFKAKAQEYTEATTWIQEDLEENVEYEAATYQLLQTTLSANAAAAASSISINTPNANAAIINSFAINDTLRVGLDPTIYKVTAVSGTGTGATATRTLTISPTLGSSQVQNAAVVATKRCNPNPTLTNPEKYGLADGLRDSISDTDHSNGITDITNNDNIFNFTKDSRRTGKNFIMSRTTTLSATPPYSVLEVSYSVAPENAHTTLTAAAATNTLNVTSATGFKPGDQLTVGTDTNNKIASISGNTITLTAALDSAQSSGSIVDASVATINTEVIPNVAFQCP